MASSIAQNGHVNGEVVAMELCKKSINYRRVTVFHACLPPIDGASVTSLRCGLQLAEFDRCLLCTTSGWQNLTMFAIYNLQVAESDDVCYVQPPGGGV
ncbi:hypothetical protein H5410_044766 [Solanum commersonii]|uniref:Uncharacterized protein n=1 Tax=Solanum commersonii TaxID=4109 RepID=A0A9J5XAU6_SOLCO|nr:hypothetical protein H5410_044766 [Solanum commersonii]